MKGPFAAIAVLFCSGILIGKCINIPFFYVWAVCVFLIFITLLLINKRFLSELLILVLAFLLGLAGWQGFVQKNSSHIKNFISTSPVNCTISGIVKNDPATKRYKGEWKTIFTLKVDSLNKEGTLFKTQGLVYVVLTNKKPLNIEYGDILETRGSLSEPDLPTNPGGFNLKEHLFKSDIYGVFRIKGGSAVELIREAKSAHFIRAIYRLRHKLSNMIDSNLEGDYASILKAMLLGERQDIPYKLNDSFIRTGTIHILSISGMHVALFAFLVFIFLKVLRIRPTMRYVLTATLLICYAILTGLKPPIVRATVMGLVVLLGFILRRQQDIYNSLGLAALIILFINPAQLFDVGFQLSFISVISIMYITEKISFMVKIPAKKDKYNIPDKFLKVLISSFSAWIGVLPAVAFYFNIFSPVTVFANIAVIPLLGAIVAGAITFIASGFLSLRLGFIFSQVTWFGLFILKTLVEFFEKFPFGYSYVKTPSTIWIICYYTILLIALNYRKLRIKPANIVITILVILNIFIYKNPIFYKSDKLKITFLDVGDRDSIFIRFPAGLNMLVDTGKGNAPDMARSAVIPFLFSEGVTCLDYALLTHPHADHTGGLKSILSHIKVRRIIDNGFNANIPIEVRHRKIAAGKGIGTISLYRGCEMDIGEVKVYVLNPPRVYLNTAYSNINDTSILLKIIYKDFSVLLCGDIEQEVIKNLLGYEDLLKAVIIKIPHHGSRNAVLLEQFIREVTPEVAIISGGRSYKRQALPYSLSNEILKKMKLISNDATGAITITSNGEKYSIKNFKCP